MHIPLPGSSRLKINIYYTLPAALIAILGLYLAIQRNLKPENKKNFHPSNLPAQVLAETTIAPKMPAKETVAVEKAEAKGAEAFTVVGGERYRLPLTSEEYVVEVRQVVKTAMGGEM
ncbi:MAG: hypothetical protein Q9200_006510 [Gallowayella weberi]